MRKFLKTMTVTLAAAAFAVLPALVVSQVNLFGVQVQPFRATPVSQIIVAADTDVALFIGYSGTTAGATVAVEADGNLTFTSDGSTAYDGFECPVSGALGGIIDVSNAACDTLGEVVDIINADTGEVFIAYIAAGLRSWSSNDSFLADAADTDVLRPEGEIVYWDSSVLDDTTIFLSDQPITAGGKPFWGDVVQGQIKLRENPFSNSETVLIYAQEKITNAGTIGNFEAYCVVEKYLKAGGSETVTTMYTEVGGATTALGEIDEFINAGGLRCVGGKVVVTILASGADTSAVLLHGFGYRFPRQ